jgi:hypothetical protein
MAISHLLKRMSDFYPPLQGWAVAMLRAARDLETLRQNLRFECDQLREEVREARAELARLQAIESARAAERDPKAALN